MIKSEASAKICIVMEKSYFSFIGAMKSRWQRKAVLALLVLGLLLPFGIKADDDDDEEAVVTEEQTVSY